MGDSDYSAYLGSNLWRRRREKFLDGLAKVNKLYCARCLRPFQVGMGFTIHHIRFASRDRWGNEPDSGLELWCRFCHETHHRGGAKLMKHPPANARFQAVVAADGSDQAHPGTFWKVCDACSNAFVAATDSVAEQSIEAALKVVPRGWKVALCPVCGEETTMPPGIQSAEADL